MSRYTEYHNGVAVIRDKRKHKEAIEKLAKIEDDLCCADCACENLYCPCEACSRLAFKEEKYMIFTWVIIIIVALVGLGLSAFFIYGIREEGGISYIVGLIVTLVITVGICCGIGWWLYNTEGGKRAIKDTQSNVQGGIERTVTVYGFDGDVIQKYSGKFDISYDSERIKFDDEKGKRHVIYYTTGTVIIDEN